MCRWSYENLSMVTVTYLINIFLLLNVVIIRISEPTAELYVFLLDGAFRIVAEMSRNMTTFVFHEEENAKNNVTHEYILASLQKCIIHFFSFSRDMLWTICRKSGFLVTFIDWQQFHSYTFTTRFQCCLMCARYCYRVENLHQSEIYSQSQKDYWCWTGKTIWRWLHKRISGVNNYEACNSYNWCSG